MYNKLFPMVIASRVSAAGANGNWRVRGCVSLMKNVPSELFIQNYNKML